MPQTLQSAGKSEKEFISQVRDELEDVPVFKGTETAIGNGTNKVFQVPAPPIYDGTQYGTPFWNITVGGSPVTLVTRYEALTSGTVYVDFQTGIAVFGTAPGASVEVAFSHSSCRWLDRRIAQALKDGMAAMYPKVFQWQSADLTMATLKWEYNLPPIFNDPRIKIVMVEQQEIPQATNRFREISKWRRTANNTIMIMDSQAFTPGSQVRVQYKAPYENLSELEAQVAELPVLYAKGTLIQAAESKRIRFDQASTTQNEQANPIGSSTNLGATYLNRFYQRLAELNVIINSARPRLNYDL